MAARLNNLLRFAVVMDSFKDMLANCDGRDGKNDAENAKVTRADDDGKKTCQGA